MLTSYRFCKRFTVEKYPICSMNHSHSQYDGMDHLYRRVPRIILLLFTKVRWIHSELYITSRAKQISTSLRQHSTSSRVTNTGREDILLQNQFWNQNLCCASLPNWITFTLWLALEKIKHRTIVATAQGILNRKSYSAVNNRKLEVRENVGKGNDWISSASKQFLTKMRRE